FKPQPSAALAFTSATIDASGEMVAYIGRAVIQGGPGTTKTLNNTGSSAISFRTGTVTWAASGTTVRVGIQDVHATTGPVARPVEDWSTGSPPYGDLVQGTDALSSNTWTSRTITAGSRSISHGDLIAVVFDMTTRNGAD